MDEVESKMLPDLFGHRSFRPGQREVIRKVLSGESCLAMLPTGAGKSLLYMLPSQLLDGITLVVSPLLALMRDQVEALRSQGIAAVRLDSTMSLDEVRNTVKEIVSKRVKVLYVSPERFNNEAFRRMLASTKVAMFVVDEAHCISEWGHAFRPDYLRLANFATFSKAQVRLALTATATKRVAADILDKLEIGPESVIRQSSIRRNLDLNVVRFDYPKDSYEDRLTLLVQRIDTLTSGGGPAIVYVSRQKLADRLAEDLCAGGFNAKAYHAGMESTEREDVERWFLSRKKSYSKAPIVVG
jgi:ATP-dependent DNA helicase RecQ